MNVFDGIQSSVKTAFLVNFIFELRMDRLKREL
jgi:hypothetical protein